MLTVNRHLAAMQGGYLFAEIANRVQKFQSANKNVNLIRLGIGDVTRPLAPAVVSAMRNALDEMGNAETFQGYPPYGGYDFLREDIAANDYKGLGISPDEIFVSDGAKSDTANFIDILGLDNTVAVCDPVYPVYADTNVMAGRKITYLPCTRENGFVPEPPPEGADIIYLCYPNNPTGGVAAREQLQKWVDRANGRGAVILYDGAYEAFITQPGIPRSIYEISGAKTCAVEFRSFSKTAGFTGVRCAYAVVPKDLRADGVSLHTMWARRQSTKFNGVSYIVQRGAQAVYTSDGAAQVRENIAYYLENTGIIFGGLQKLGIEVYGGVNSPYVWMRTPEDMPSWDFFDLLINRANVVGTPGAGFGQSGEGYFRLTGFGTRENTVEAVERIKAVL